MDIIEEFEKLPEIANLISESGAYFADESIYFCDNDFACGYLNGALYAFQEHQKKIDALKAKFDENHRLIHIDDLRTLVHWTGMMASEYGDDDAVEIALRVKSMIEDQK